MTIGRAIETVRACLVLPNPFAAQAVVISGTISDWQESGPLEVIGDGGNGVSPFRSINTTDLGFFYGSGFTGDGDVAAGVSDVFDATLDATWWFQTDGSGNFGSSAAVPEPATLALPGIGLSGLGLVRRGQILQLARHRR